MIVNVIKIVNLNAYIEYLPTKHSEKSYMSITKDIENAHTFESLDTLDYIDLDFIEDCYRESFKKDEKLSIEIVKTFSRD